MRKDGSRPSLSSIVATIEDVVVLPWVPATATVSASLERYESIFARGQMGMPSSRARRTSGLVSGMAVEVTMTWGMTASMVAASWPTWTSMPASSSSRT